MKKQDRVEVWNKYDQRCAYCGCKLEYSDMQVDHIQPKYREGKDEMGNYNPSCRSCNFYKSAATVDVFRERMSSLHERLEKIFIIRLGLKYGIIEYKPFSGKFYFEKEELSNDL